jgi:glycine cleavage system transcriptional repressor
VAKNVVLTGVGHDRVGIVAELTGLLFDMGCNLLDSSMTLLRGEFAVILMVRLPEQCSFEDLKAKISNVENNLGLTVHIRELPDSELQPPDDQGEPYIISVYGADKPGIVSGITKVLSKHKVNITDVETKHTGDLQGRSGSVFLMVLEVNAPTSLTEAQLRAVLTDVSKTLKVDVSLQSLNVVQL